TAFVAYFYVEREMTTSLENEIIEDRGLLSQIYFDSGEVGLLDAINSMRHTLRTEFRAIGLFDRTGNKLAGNIDAIPVGAGWVDQSVTMVAKSTPTQKVTENFYLNTDTLGPFVLVVGRNLTLIELQQSRMLAAFALMGLVFSASVLAIGYFTSLQTLIKLERISTTLDLVSQGSSAERLVVSDRNDQIDRIARGMNRHLDRLSQLLATTKATAAAIAHDLRTPLSRAFLSVDTAFGALDKGRDPRPQLEGVASELSRLRSVFDAILRISHLESTDNPALTQIPLAPILAEMAETFGPIAEEKGQTLILTPVQADLTALGDAAMVAQLAANLVQNAITHCPPGSTIHLAAMHASGQTTLTVVDNGPGIPEADRARVFDLFYRSDSSRTGNGNGLGLALVKAIAEHIGATVTLRDANPGLRVEVAFASDPAAT
ncbi:MAG: HAMP domain-containing sensor histidine kinase, partial [Paracoccaceae bacterium]